MRNYFTFGRHKWASRLFALSVFCTVQLCCSFASSAPELSAVPTFLRLMTRLPCRWARPDFVFCHQDNDNLNGLQAPLATQKKNNNPKILNTGPIKGKAKLVNDARCNDAVLLGGNGKPIKNYFNAVSIKLKGGAQGSGSIRYKIKDGDRNNFTRNQDNNQPGCNSPGINDDSCGILTVTVGATNLTVTSGPTAPAIDENSGAGHLMPLRLGVNKHGI